MLVVTNDFDPSAAKAARQLARALGRVGYPAVVRDTRLNRWGAEQAVEAEDKRREAFETAVVAKWSKLVDDYGVDLVISFDAHWLLSGRLFVTPESRVQHIHSIWTGEARLPEGPVFPLDPRVVLNGPKVSHHCSDDARAEKLRALGIGRVNRLKNTGSWDEMLREILA